VHAQNAVNLYALVERKKIEVQNLLREHFNDYDPLQLRLQYYADESQFLVKQSLRRAPNLEDRHQLSVICDLKRQTPCGPQSGPRQLADYATAGDIAQQMVSYGADAIMVNTDFGGWGGDLLDLTTTAQNVNCFRLPKKRHIDAMVQQSKDGMEQQLDVEKHWVPDPPKKDFPVIMKDIIIHPIQVALALETGANCVHLCATILGAGLEDLLDAVTIMGTEAIVEVHTPNELDYALELGANMIMVNNWDRLEGVLHRSQALALAREIPPHIVTIAAGGIFSPEQAFELADEGYDAVVLGRAISEHENIKKLINQIRGRKGVQRQYLGWGLKGDDFESL